jgi:hypothetical protein
VGNRLFGRVLMGPRGCWIFAAGVDRFGYGRLFWKGKTHRAHRVAYTVARGELPSGVEVCHTCDTPRCVRPDHLFLGTRRENANDMGRKGRARNQNKDRTHCQRGHPFDADNTYYRLEGGRRCRACDRARSTVQA